MTGARSRSPARSYGAWSRGVAVIAVLLGAVPRAGAAPDPQALVVELGSPDRAAVEAAVAALEALPAAPDDNDLANALFRAARACEDTLADPRRALALYERIARDHGSSRIAASAERRVAALRVQLGGANQHAARAAALARLIADADTLPADRVERTAQELLEADWPGAPEAGLWLAEWLRRTGRLADARDRYAEVARRWPDSPQAQLAIRGGAGNALDARDWDRAEQLAAQLPAVDEADRIVREDLLELAARGRQIDRWYARAWLIALGCLLALIASLVEAARRGGYHRPRLRPPIEVLFLAPVAAVMIGVALTTHQLIAPAVLILTLGGLVLAWLSGATLDTLRARHRPVRARAVLHVAICLVAVVALLYVALVRDNLLEMVIETVRFGPEP